MKCSLILFVVTASIISVIEGKLHKFIDPCKMDDPDIVACVKRNIENLKPLIVEGIPESHMPIDPLHVENPAVVNLGPGFRVEIQNLVVHGVKNFEISDLVVNLDANTYAFTILVPKITANGTYVINATIASLPIQKSGRLEITARSIIGHGTVIGKLVSRGGKTYNTLPRWTMKLNVADYTAMLEDLPPPVRQVANDIINERKSVVLASVLPVIERTVTERLSGAANNVLTTGPWEGFFVKT